MLIPQDSDLFPIANSCNYGKISFCQVRFKQYSLQKVFTTIKTLNYRLPCVRTIYADICSSHWTVMPRAETYFINTFVVPNSELTWNGKHRNKELALVFEIQTKKLLLYPLSYIFLSKHLRHFLPIPVVASGLQKSFYLGNLHWPCS